MQKTIYTYTCMSPVNTRFSADCAGIDVQEVSIELIETSNLYYPVFPATWALLTPLTILIISK